MSQKFMHAQLLHDFVTYGLGSRRERTHTIIHTSCHTFLTPFARPPATQNIYIALCLCRIVAASFSVAIFASYVLGLKSERRFVFHAYDVSALPSLKRHHHECEYWSRAVQPQCQPNAIYSYTSNRTARTQISFASSLFHFACLHPCTIRSRARERKNKKVQTNI